MIGVGLIMPVVEGVMAPQQLLDKSYIRFCSAFCLLTRRTNGCCF